MDTTPERSAIFISHANPEDNAFVRWLGAKLTALGYEVWADVMRLKGGADWSRELDDALLHRAAKVLVVCTSGGLQKDGVRREIEMASVVANKIGDKHFIIPLRLDDYEQTFRIALLQYIDFKRSWSSGYVELAERLIDFPELRREQNRSVDAWLDGQRAGAAKLIEKDEWLISNWLPITSLPIKLCYCEPPVGFQLERFVTRGLHNWPVVPHQGGILTFASPKNGFLSENIPAKVVREIDTKTFLDEGWQSIGIPRHDAWKKLADLGNAAFEAFLHSKGLTSQDSGHGPRRWFGGIKAVPQGMIPYNWTSSSGEIFKGRRQIMGRSDNRGVFWHYAISGKMRTAPFNHLRISASLIFTSNGMDGLNDHRRAHLLRRSFAKAWRNARWRDMLLTFLWWLSEGKNQLQIPVSAQSFFSLELPPSVFKCPVTVPMEEEVPEDDDDPDIEPLEFDDDQEYFDEVTE
ncbi:toll/interleukin-1 receptor domain-containing protein [Betaproteobacteria bacterium SCN2]|nr:toll/interleukin-1 receptor domain-containing protein [Betaproteobacteria bacterium SCN2]